MSFFSSTIQLRESEALALEIKVSSNGVKSRVLSIGNTIKKSKKGRLGNALWSEIRQEYIAAES